MSEKILGIDIGVSSVGWGVIDSYDNILISGVRLFEELDSGDNVKRRSFRGARRLKSRRKLRIKDMRDLLIEHKFYSEDYTNINPYEARLKGLTTKLSNKELSAALIHLAKRRGSSLEVAGEETLDGVNPKAVLARHDQQLKEKYVVELQLEKLEESGKIRDNENIFRTKDYLKEANQILKNQKVNEDFIKKTLQIIERRRHFSEGPGSQKSPSPFGRWRYVESDLRDKIVKSFTNEEKKRYLKQQFTYKHLKKDYIVLKDGNIINKKPLNLIDLMRGKCSVYLDEFRAPKSSFSATIHNFLNDVNNMKIVSEENRNFTKQEKQKALETIKTEGRFRPDNINGFLKLFGFTIDDVIGFRIDTKEKPVITDFKIYRELLTIFKNNNLTLEDSLADQIAEILTKTQVIEERKEALKEYISSQKAIEEIADLTKYTGYHGFSFKAIYQLNEEMLKTNQNQQQILSSTLQRDQTQVAKLEFDNTLILSSVARRAHREALRVISELIKEFGNFKRIVIETTREKNSREERKRIQDMQKRYLKQKESALELLKDAGFSGDDVYSGQTILKIRLYEEQSAKCAYSGKHLNFVKLITDPKAYEIDHIIPRSISQDNSYSNKVLVIPEVNQLKGNTTPFGYFVSGKARKEYPINNYNAFKDIVLGNINYQKNAAKRRNLLYEEDITKYSSLEEFTNRNLVDTSYAARSLMTTIKNYFKSNKINTTVHTIRGKQTDLFRAIGRTLWIRDNKEADLELNPFLKNRDNYMHHAIDALIIAGLSNQRTFKYLFDLEKSKHETYVFSKKKGEPFTVDPVEDSELIKFIKNVGNVSKDVVRFSWKIDRKINRSFSDQTIYSTRMLNGEEYVVKKYSNIYEINKDKLEKILIDEKEKLLVYQHDRKTFEIIKQAYLQYEHEKFPLKAYLDEHGKIKKHGKGPDVTNLKYLANRLGSHIDITRDTKTNKRIVLLQISPYRIDVYKNDKNRYRFVTITYASFKKDNRGFYIDKDEYQNKLLEKQIDEKYKFLYSFNRNEIIEIKQRNQDYIRYRFIATNNDIKNIIEVKSIKKHDKDRRLLLTIGAKTESIKKYAVSPAGRVNIIKQEELTLVR